MSSPRFCRAPARLIGVQRLSFQRIIIILPGSTFCWRLSPVASKDATTEFDCVLFDWQDAGLQLPSAMRSYLFTVEIAEVTKLGTLSEADWSEVQKRLRLALEI